MLNARHHGRVVWTILRYNTAMSASEKLSLEFFDRPVLQVAPELLGKRLIRVLNGQHLGGIIIEVEAYRGEEDLACHARSGLTPRNAALYGPPGHAYVYFTYGMHWLLNAVTGPDGFPAAVLLRAIIPTEGLETIAERRAGQDPKQWCNGPAKICMALGVDGSFNEQDLCSSQSRLWIENGIDIPKEYVQTGPRVGIKNVPEPWRSMPWRYRAVLPHDYLEKA
jgi:DNA-3-methyladenine glycosylase